MNIIKTFLIRDAGYAITFTGLIIQLVAYTIIAGCGKCDVASGWSITGGCLMVIGVIYTGYIICCTKPVNYDPPVQSGYATMSSI